MINKEEYRVLMGLDDKWEWIARDLGSNRDGNLFAYSVKPFKHDIGVWDYDRELHHIDNRLFQFIQWKNEEPCNIAELIEEYEKDYKGSWEHAIEFIKEVRRESEETELKSKRKLIEKWESAIGSAEFYGKGKEEELISYMKDFVSDLNQLGETESEQSDKKIRELESYNDDLVRDNNQLRNAMDNQEVLSQEWIDEYAQGDWDEWVYIEDLQNLIVPEKELPEIPQFVSGWIEETKKQNKSYIYAIAQIYDKHETDESLSEEENRIFQWMEAYDNDEVFARAWLDSYKIKKEPKYNVEIKVESLFGPVGLFLYKKCDEIFVGDDFEDYCPKEDKYRLTEYEIKKYDERFWPFRKPVEEVEENDEN